MSVSVAWLAIIVPLSVVAATALTNYLTARRSGSGRIRTSEAEELWAQTQVLLTNMQQRLDRELHRSERAEDQRDKLMDLQQQQTMPILEAISKSQQHVLGLLTELAGRRDRPEEP